MPLCWQRRCASDYPSVTQSVTAPLTRGANGRTKFAPYTAAREQAGNGKALPAGSSPAAATTGVWDVPRRLPYKNKPRPVKAAPSDQAAPVQFRLGKKKTERADNIRPYEIHKNRYKENAMTSKLPPPREGAEQATLFHWAEMQSIWYPELELLFHIPNGGKRSKSEAARFKAEGVKPGVPDICLPVARGEYHGLYIELKRRSGNHAADKQLDWLEKLNNQGYKTAICYGWEEAATVITKYLKESAA